MKISYFASYLLGRGGYYPCDFLVPMIQCVYEYYGYYYPLDRSGSTWGSDRSGTGSRLKSYNL